MQLTEARSEIVDKERQLERLLSELDNAKQELGAIRQERDYYVVTVDESIKDHKHWQVLALTRKKGDRPMGASEANRILTALSVGKPSPQYKGVKAVLDAMMP